MNRDESVWAPPGPPPPADPYAAHPRYPEDNIWLPPDALAAQARAADLSAWLDRRFPDRGTPEERDRRARRRMWVVGALSAVVVVTLGVVLAAYGWLDAPPPWRRPGLSLFGPLLVAWAALGVALVLATRSRPAVSHAERDVLARLTAAERRDLREDLRYAPGGDAGHLDVVAAAWLARRGEVLLMPWRVLFGLSLATQWQLHPLTPVALLMALMAGRELVEGVLDLLAARAWLAGRRGPEGPV